MDPRTLDRLEQDLLTLAALVPDRDRDVVGLDFETSGLSPDQDVILELGAACLTIDGRVVVTEQLYNPGRRVPDGILELTGLTQAELDAAPPWDRDAAFRAAAALSDCDFLGYNIKHFDLPFFKAQCAKVNVGFDYAAARIVDASAIWRQVETRTLADYVARFAGRDHAGAHRAVADVAGTASGLVGFLRTFPAVPRTIQGLHDVGFPRDPSWADAEGKLAWRGGVLTINFGASRRGQDVAALARDRAFKGGRSYLEWMVRADFPEDTKTILRDLLHGGKLPLEAAAPAAPGEDVPF